MHVVALSEEHKLTTWKGRGRIAWCVTRRALWRRAPVSAGSDHEDSMELGSTCHALIPEPVPPSSASPPITHDLVARDECLMCHNMGIGYAPGIPENYDAPPVDLCQTCHRPAPGEVPLAETPVTGVTLSQLPYPVENRADCRLCHDTAFADASQFPDEQADRANEGCLACHALFARQETLTGLEEDEDDDEPPSVPHSLENRNDCRLCHESGLGDAPEFPGDHADYENEVCQVCHQAGT